MKLTKSKIGLFTLFLFVFIVGGILGLGTSSYLYYRYVFSNMADETAINVSTQLSYLCLLRIGDVNTAIDLMETAVDTGIVNITQTPNIPQTDYRYRVLRGVKTYRQLYPSKLENPKLSEALKNIPGIEEIEFKCESPLCRLVKYHSSKENN
jgi:hypothetical protein